MGQSIIGAPVVESFPSFLSVSERLERDIDIPELGHLDRP